MTDNHSIETYDHTGFITPSIEATIDFWTNVMGFEAQPIAERAEPWVEGFTGVSGGALRIVHLFGHNAHLEFIEFAKSGQEPVELQANLPATGHVCFKVPDVQASYDAIISAGGTPVGQITTITEGAVAGSKGLYLKDPNGVLIELLQIVK